jgi:hypothetical protein
MRKLKITSIILFGLFSTISCFAQVNGRQGNANFEGNLVANNIMRGRNILQEVMSQGEKNELTIADVEGEPYFQKFFSIGDLMYKDSLNLGKYLMRYNAYTDEIEVKNEQTTNVINKADYIRVILNNKNYVTLNYAKNNGSIEKGFFIEKVKGTHGSLFLKRHKTVRQGQEAKTSFHKNTPPTFIDHEAYFLKFADNQPLKIKLKKTKILNAFPDKTDALKKYVKQEALNLETEAGLISLVEHYNGLN